MFSLIGSSCFEMSFVWYRNFWKVCYMTNFIDVFSFSLLYSERGWIGITLGKILLLIYFMFQVIWFKFKRYLFVGTTFIKLDFINIYIEPFPKCINDIKIQSVKFVIDWGLPKPLSEIQLFNSKLWNMKSENL